MLPPLFMHAYTYTSFAVNAGLRFFLIIQKTVPGPCSLFPHENLHQPFSLFALDKSYSSCHYLCSIII